MGVRIKIRRDTSSNWQSTNPVLEEGELGYELDTGRLKIGDGKTDWNNLPYVVGERVPKDFDFNNVASKEHNHNLLDISDFPTPSKSNTYLTFNGTNLTWEDIKVKAKVYTPGESYTKNELIVDDKYSNLYIAIKDFTATDIASDLSSNNIKAISGSFSSSGYKQYETSASSGDTVLISLTKPNYNQDRHIFILQKQDVSTIDVNPFSFNKSDEFWNYDDKYVVMNNSVKLKNKDEINFVKNSFYYESSLIDLKKYVDKNIVGEEWIINSSSSVLQDLTSPSEAPYRASASGSYSVNPPKDAFDDNLTNGWGNDQKIPCWLQYEFDEPKIVVGYRLRRNSSQPGGWSSDDYSPRDWKFQGSNDGVNWVDLDVRSNEFIPGDLTVKEYMFKNNKPYKYYRIYITKAGASRWCNITEMELLGYQYTYKILFEDVNTNKLYKYDESTSSWIYVTDKSSVTENDFKNKGMYLIDNLKKEDFEKLSDKIKVLLYTDDTSITDLKLLIDILPFEKLIVQKSLLNLKDYESINKITINTSGNGDIKFLISRDLNNWYKYDTSSSSWKLVKSGALDINNKDDINLVLTEGNTPSEISALTWNEIKNLYSDNKPDYIAFAFALKLNNKTDNITLDSIILNVKPKPIWKDVTDKCDIYQSNNNILITFNLDGEFKVNYQD